MNPDIFNLEFFKLDVLRPEVQAFATGFPVTLLHAFATLLLLLVGSSLYAWLTPYKEVKQAKEGNHAAAVGFGGVIIGLAIPLAASMSASTSLREIFLWGGATILLQLIVFRLVDFAFNGLPQRMSEGETSAAVLLVAAKLAASLILAAAVAG